MKKIILILVLFVIQNSLVLAFTPLQPIKTYTNSSLKESITERCRYYI